MEACSGTRPVSSTKMGDAYWIKDQKRVATPTARIQLSAKSAAAKRQTQPVKRRSFFSRCAALVAAVALAPEIAFSRKLDLPDAAKLAPFWTESTILSRCYSDAYLRFLEITIGEVDFVTDQETADQLKEMHDRYSQQRPNDQ